MQDGEGQGRLCLQIVGAVITTLLAGLACWVAALVARGRALEDACLSREPSVLWAPVRLTAVVRGRIPKGWVTYRCESVADPRYGYFFTDLVPLVATVIAAGVWLGAVVLVWAAALRRRPSD